MSESITLLYMQANDAFFVVKPIHYKIPQCMYRAIHTRTHTKQTMQKTKLFLIASYAYRASSWY